MFLARRYETRFQRETPHCGWEGHIALDGGRHSLEGGCHFLEAVCRHAPNRRQRSFLGSAPGPTTRWTTTLSSKVNLPDPINFRALCGANLVTYPPLSGRHPLESGRHFLEPVCRHVPHRRPLLPREFIDYKTSMITDEDPLRGLLFY